MLVNDHASTTPDMYVMSLVAVAWHEDTNSKSKSLHPSMFGVYRMRMKWNCLCPVPQGSKVTAWFAVCVPGPLADWTYQVFGFLVSCFPSPENPPLKSKQASFYYQ